MFNTTLSKRLFARALLLLLVAAHATTGLIAQVAAWRTLSPATPPSARWGHSMATEESTGKIILFGGADGITLLADTWEWDNGQWQQLHVPGPTPRTRAALAWDPRTQSLVLWGGHDGSAALSDTWQFANGMWIRQLPVLSPGGTVLASASTDRRLNLVTLFVMDTQTLTAQPWQWHGSTWAPALTSPPPTHCWPELSTFDESTGECLVVSGGLARGLWSWNGSRWASVLGSTGMPPGVPTSFTFDRRRLVPVLGTTDSNPMGSSRVWELRSGGWVDVGYQAAGAACWDPRGGTSLIFGGFSGRANNATLEYGWLRHIARTATYGQGCPGSAPVQLTTSSTPVVGTTLHVNAVGVPSTALLGTLALGLSRTHISGFSLPLPLDYIGMLGCVLLQSMEDPNGPLVVTPPTATASITIPLNHALPGRSVFLQALILAPGINSLGVVVSDGLGIDIGN